MGRPKGSKNHKGYEFGNVLNMAVKVGETKTDGKFKINVTDDEGNELYSNDNETFEYQQISSFAEMIASEGGELTEDAIGFLGEVFAGDANGKAVKSLIEGYNTKLKANAKAAAYAKLVNQYKPLSEDDALKAFERMVDNYVRISKVTPEVAREALKALMPAKAE